MRYVVGYTPSDRGADAVALASAMARAQGAHLDLVYVVDRRTPYVAMNPEGNRVSAAEQEVLTAEREGMALVPKDLEARFHVRQADSHAAGLIDAAVEYKAGLIVVGAASAGLFKRYTIGSAANALLHASPVPVALAPRGYRHSPCWPGALITTLAWIGGTLLLGPAISGLNHLGLTYGALSGVVVALLFFYSVGFALVLGA